MRRAILRALSKNKEDRQPTAREFFSELSDGGRMTVESHHDSNPGGSSGTAAMPQVPNFMGGAGAPMMSPPMAAPVIQPVAAVPPAPMGGGRKEGSGKGLVIGLGVVGGILLISIAVLAARSLGSKKDDVAPIPLDTGSAGTGSGAIGTGSVANIEPIAAPTPTESGKAGATSPPERVAPIEPKPATNPTSKPAPPPVNPAQACEACIEDARSGNISGAAANFSRCSDAPKKTQCTQAVRNNAPAAVRSAALNGNCAQAKAIIAAAQGIGAASGKLLSSLTGSSCK
jgi:serine/threonine-protein kinase